MKAELELRHLRVFAAVVEAGTYTRAARALGISQSTVSETLSALERALGVALFRKPGRGTALTASGEILLAYARRMSALSADLVTALSEAATETRATVVIAAVESVSAYVLPSRLAALRVRWPAVRAEVVIGSCPAIRERVAAGESDLGLVLEAETSHGTGDVLARARLLVLGAPGHPLARRSAGPEELRRCDFYMCDAAGDYHQALRHHFDVAELPAPRMQPMGTIEGVKRGILAGGTALGLLPEHAVEPELRDGVLAEVRTSPALPRVVLRAVRPPGAPQSSVIDALLASLRGSPARGLQLTAQQPEGGRQGRSRETARPPAGPRVEGLERGTGPSRRARDS